MMQAIPIIQETEQTILTSEEIRLFASLGYQAAIEGYASIAMNIFEGLRVLLGDQVWICIGISLAHIYANCPKAAASFLQNHGLRIFPEDPQLKLFLSLSFMLQKLPTKANSILDKLNIQGMLNEQDELLKNKIQEKVSEMNVKSRFPKPAVFE
jgi:hypothetical protein